MRAGSSTIPFVDFPAVKRPKKEKKTCKPFLKSLQSRELGFLKNLLPDIIHHVPFRLPIAWRKRVINPGVRNKIFASQWITNDHVVYGTKCNQLVLYNVTSDASLEIPLIGTEASNAESFDAVVCGIHAIQRNSSKSLLATGGANVNHIGVYLLPELSPYCLLKNFHTDWVFDMRWLDDSYLASCSRDSSLAIWRIPPFEDSHHNTADSYIRAQSESTLQLVERPVAHAVSPVRDDRFRALEHLAPFSLLTVVSMSRRLYLYDAVRMSSDTQAKPVFTLALRDAYQEAVALRRWPSFPNCVALATHHCVLMFDIRCSDPIGATGCCIHPPLAVSGVRSLNFAGDILSYGSSNGQLHFYDFRNGQHLPTHLEIGPGWVKPNVCALDELSATPSPGAFPPFSELSFPPLLRSAPSMRPHYTSPSPSLSFFLPDFPPNNPSSQASYARNIRNSQDRRWRRLSDLSTRHFWSLIYSSAPRPSNFPSQDLEEWRSEEAVPGESASRRRRNPSREPVADPVLAVVDTSDDEDNDDNELEATPETPEVNSTVEQLVESVLPVSWRQTTSRRPSTSTINFRLADLWSDLPSVSTFSTHRRLVAVYTHEYDPSGTRLFAAGGPIASTYHGNVAALWE
ncbi:unnamed protein product [Dicrocoelium dendriticum]|nr:unnamed protein product [Dicrocoelium dendriticum]